MSFFYDLNKRLNSIRELPETTHKQLNEGAHTQGAMELNPDFRKKQPTGIMGKIAKGVKQVADFVAPGDEDLLRDLERKSGGKRPVKENSGRDIDRILANFPREVKRFKQGGELDRDLEEALWDYHYNIGNIRNYNADASAFIAQDLADHLGLKEADVEEGNRFTGNLAKARAAGKKQADLDGDGDMEPVRETDYSAKKARAGKDIGKPGKNFEKIAKSAGERYGSKAAGERVAGAVLNKLRGKNESVEEATKEIPGGRRHTAEPGGYGRKSDDDAPKPVVKKGRGRPKKGSDSETGEVMRPDWSAFGVGKVNLPKHKGAVTKHKMVGEGDDADVEAAIRMLKKAGYTVSKDKKELDEKAVSKAQRAAAGIAYAAKKGDLPKSELKGASKEMAKMPAGELKKFAKTKEKGLPEKKKKEVEETTVAGSVAPAAEAPKKSKGGINFGGSIYDSVNREVENLIAESMNINMSMNTDQHGGPSKSLTVTATDEDADKLAALLQMAGVGAQAPEAAYADSACQVDENQPENTPDPVTGDGEMYAGGLNKPKRDVAGDGQATGTVTAVHTTDDDDEELRRIREMAGIRESKKPDFLDLDKDGDKKEPMAKAAKEKDEKKEEKVDESIFASTANLWKTYKG
jgi:hypothetical protein